MCGNRGRGDVSERRGLNAFHPPLLHTSPHPSSVHLPITLFAFLHSAQLSFLPGHWFSSLGLGSRGALPALRVWG